MGNWLCGVHSKPLHAAHYFHNIGAQVLQHWLPHDSNGCFSGAGLYHGCLYRREMGRDGGERGTTGEIVLFDAMKNHVVEDHGHLGEKTRC